MQHQPLASPLETGKPTRVRNWVLVLACGISFVLYLHRYTWGMVKLDVAKEFGLDNQQMGLLDSWFVVSYGFGQLPAGMLCDWFGARALLSGGIFLWSLAMVVIALASSWSSMVFARLMFGLGQSGCYPVLSKVSKNWFPVSMRTMAQGLIPTVFGRGGGAASFFLFGTVALGWLGLPWRWAIGLFSLLGFVIGAAFWYTFRNSPAEHPWVNDAEAELIIADDPSAAQATRAAAPWSRILGSVSVWLLLFRSIASNLADVIFVYWIPQYLLEEKGLDRAWTGALASLPLIGGALGGFCSGWLQTILLRRSVTRRWTRSSIAILGKFLAAGLMIASLQLSGPVAIAVTFLVVKFFSDWEQPVEWAAVTDIAGRSAATVFACINTAGCAGGFAGGLLVGYLLDSYKVNGVVTSQGWSTVFTVTAIEYVFAGLAWFFINCNHPLEKSTATS